MTQDEFNEKYKDYIPEGWHGLEFDKEEVTSFLDGVIDVFKRIDGFEIHQIKMKLGNARFYTNLNNSDMQFAIESAINNIIKTN
jgi:hypothetical protein